MGWNRPAWVQDGTHTHATRRSTVRSCYKKKTLKCGNCCIMAATTAEAYGGIQVHSRQHSK